MNKMLYSVSGIHNKQSKTQLKNALKQIEGIREVGVNQTTGTVQVQYAEPATEAAIRNCIENSGFKIVYE
jgi:copper chaperone